MNFIYPETIMPVIEKRCKTQLETADPLVIYSTNADEQILRLLEKKYVKKCYKQCFVTEIVKINKRSPFMSDHERAGGTCRFNVDFSVRAVVYDKDEVIPQAEIVQIMSDGLILLMTPHAGIALEPDSRLQSLKVGDKIPVRVYDSKYVPMKSTIAVQALPFTPMDQVEQWHVTLTQEDIEGIRTVLIPPPEDDAKKLAMVKELLYPYTKEVKVPKDAEIVRLAELDKGEFLISQPDWLDDPYSCLVQPPPKDSKPLTNVATILKGMAHNAIKKSRLMSHLIKLYKFDKSEKHIWQIYTDSRKTV